jgi:hypothetical protein
MGLQVFAVCLKRGAWQRFLCRAPLVKRTAKLLLCHAPHKKRTEIFLAVRRRTAKNFYTIL